MYTLVNVNVAGLTLTLLSGQLWGRMQGSEGGERVRRRREKCWLALMIYYYSENKHHSQRNMFNKTLGETLCFLVRGKLPCTQVPLV